MTDTTPVQESAADAVETVLALADSETDPLNLGLLTDEEVYLYADDVAAEGPYGTWFAALPETQRQAAAVGAVRVLTSRGEIDSELSHDGAADIRLPTQLTAAVVLRRLEAQLSLRVIGALGETWYVLRHVRGELYLREGISPQGYHALSLVRLDDAERELFLERFQLPEGAESAEPSDVDITLTETQLEAASIEITQQLRFLDDTAYIGNLATTAADGTIETSMVHVLSDARIVVGDLGAGRVHYRGITPAALRERWDAWRQAQSGRVLADADSGLNAHPDLLTAPVVAGDDAS